MQTFKAVKNNNLRYTQQACIKDKDGSALGQKESIMERWKEYGAELFERPDGELQMNENRLPPNEQEPPQLLSEVENAMKKLSSGKSPGLDW